MAIAFTPVKEFHALAGLFAGLHGLGGLPCWPSGRPGIRWLTGIEATGSSGGMISFYTLHNIANAPIIN
jgi:hypothetical protein